jgi:hypothetical protein
LFLSLGINPALPLETIRVNPIENNIIVERLEGADQWKIWCRLQDICDVALIAEKTACQINRLSGPPLYLKLTSMPEVESFVSLLDGYHRLSRRFYVNFCPQLINPSLLVSKKTSFIFIIKNINHFEKY